MSIFTRVKAAYKAFKATAPKISKEAEAKHDDYLNKWLKAYYDAAQNTKENRKSWANARDLPIPVKVDAATRRTLRARGEYEYDNNAYCGGMVDTIATDTIGATAPKLQVIYPDKGVAEELQTGWETWSETLEVNLPGKLFQAEIGRRNHGESFLVPFTDNEVETNTGVSLNIGVVPARRVTDSTLAMTGWRQVTNGILNDDGVRVDLKKARPVSFQILDEEEEINGWGTSTPVKVNSRFCYQWFKPRKINQYRGICETTASLPLFGYMRRYTLANIASAELVASMTAFMKTQNPPDEGPAQVDNWAEFEIARNMLQSLPDGWEVQIPDQKHPATTYEMFINMILREVGRILGVPFGVVSGDCSKYTYSSARLEFRSYDHMLDGDRQQCRIRVLNPIYRDYRLERAMKDPAIKKAVDSGKLYHTWRFKRRPSVDPQKDAAAADMSLKNGTTTLAEVFADRGEDWVEALEQRKKEFDKIASLKLNFSGEAIATVPTTEPELDDDGNPIEVVNVDTDTNTEGKDPVAKAVAATGSAVQDTALNGAQVTSLLAIVDKVALKQYPPDAVKGMIKTAFPATDDKIVQKFIDEIAKFTPKPLTESNPTQVPPNGKPKPATVPPEE